MSLTILVHRKLPEIGIVRWFRDPKVNIAYANGPVVSMSLEDFRSTGHDWVRRHFEEYLRIRLPEEKVENVFQPGEAKRLMKDRSAVEISRDPDGNLILAPRRIRRYDLADLEGLGKETRRIIPETSPQDVFWKTFDEVLAIAAEA
jgi:hypothetical protein